MFSLLAQTTTDPLLDWLSRAGGFGILATAVVSFLRGWIVPGNTHKEVRLERDRAMEFMYKQAEIAQRALEVAGKKK